MSNNVNEITKDKLDIFDKIMKWPILNFFEPFYKKNKSVLLYLFFGGVAFLMYFVLYFLFVTVLNLNEIISTIFCNIICIVFQFFTNRTYCFDSHVDTIGEFFKQMGEFFAGRAGTFVADMLITFIFITCLHYNELIIKIIDQVIIIVSNYLISKFWVFKKK